MNKDTHFIAQLKAAKAPLNSSFKARLKRQFTEQAEVPQGSLFFKTLNMKKLSLASLSGALVFALILSLLSTPTLHPEDILAQAEAAYESLNTGILHEKVTIEYDAKGGPTVNEFWHDSTGNYYHIWYNALTNEFINGYLYRIQDDGTARFYSDFPSDGDVIAEFKEGQFQGAGIHDEAALACYQVLQNDDEQYQAKVLQLNKNDLESESGGMGYIDQNLSSEDGHRLEELSTFGHKQSSFEEAKSIIQSLKKSESVYFEEETEDGKTYYVFTDHVVKKEMDYDFTFVYTFDAESYQIVQTEVFQKGEAQYVVHYESENLSLDSADLVYDTSAYGLKGRTVIATVEALEYPESGCYNDFNQKLSDEETKEILNLLPEETLLEFQSKEKPSF